MGMERKVSFGWQLGWTGKNQIEILRESKVHCDLDGID